MTFGERATAASLFVVAAHVLGCQRELRRIGELEYLSDAAQVALDRESFSSSIKAAQSTFRLAGGEDDTAVNGWTPLFSFVHVSDIQLRDYAIHYKGPAEERLWRKFSGATVREASLDQNDEFPFASLVSAINEAKDDPSQPKPLFLIHTGDSVDAGTVGELYRFLSIANRLTIPWYNVVGNHDVFLMGNFTESDIDFHDLPTDSIPLLINRNKFAYLHGSDDYGTVLEHGPTINPKNGMPASQFHGFDCIRPDCRQIFDEAQRPVIRPYYSVRFAVRRPTKPLPLAVRLVVLDTNAQHGDVPHAGRTELPAYGARGYVDPEQFAWLKRELAAAQGEGDAVLVFGHHTLFDPPSASWFEMLGDLRGTDPSGGRGFLLRDLLKRYPNVIAYFGGHTHVARIVQANDSSLVEVTAPSLHEYPQIGFLVTVYEKERKDKRGSNLGLRVRAAQGVPTPNSTVAIRLKTSCNGARAEWLRHNKGNPSPDCFVVDAHRFFPDLAPMPTKNPCPSADDPAPEPNAAVAPIRLTFGAGPVSLRGLSRTVTKLTHGCYDIVLDPSVATLADETVAFPGATDTPLFDVLEELTRRLPPVEWRNGRTIPARFKIESRKRVVRFFAGPDISFRIGDYVDYKYSGELIKGTIDVREEVVAVDSHETAEGIQAHTVVRRIELRRDGKRLLAAMLTMASEREGDDAFIRGAIQDDKNGWRESTLGELETEIAKCQLPHRLLPATAPPPADKPTSLAVGRVTYDDCVPVSAPVDLIETRFVLDELRCPVFKWPNATGTLRVDPSARPVLARSIIDQGNALQPARQPRQ